MTQQGDRRRRRRRLVGGGGFGSRGYSPTVVKRQYERAQMWETQRQTKIDDLEELRLEMYRQSHALPPPPPQPPQPPPQPWWPTDQPWPPPPPPPPPLPPLPLPPPGGGGEDIEDTYGCYCDWVADNGFDGLGTLLTLLSLVTAAVLYTAGWYNVAPPNRIAGMLHSESHSQLIDEETATLTEGLESDEPTQGGQRSASSSPDKFEMLEMQPAVQSPRSPQISSTLRVI